MGEERERERERVSEWVSEWDPIGMLHCISLWGNSLNTCASWSFDLLLFVVCNVYITYYQLRSQVPLFPNLQFPLSFRMIMMYAVIFSTISLSFYTVTYVEFKIYQLTNTLCMFKSTYSFLHTRIYFWEFNFEEKIFLEYVAGIIFLFLFDEWPLGMMYS